MKKVYLHIGLHKTATSSFQLTCKFNRENLFTQGFVYPIFNSSYIHLENIDNHSVPFFSLFSDNPKTYHININYAACNIDALHKDYHTCIDTALKSDKDVIFSGEDISNLPLQNLQSLKSFFETYKVELIPFGVIRSPYEYVCSVRQEMIRDGLYVKDSMPMISPTIGKLQKVFPNIQLFPFRTICKHTFGPSGFLFEKMGINPKQIKFVNSNKGMANIIARVQNALSQREPWFVEKNINPYFISLASYENKYFNIPYLMTEEEFDRVKDTWNTENDFLKNNFGEEFIDREIRLAKEDGTVALCEWLIENLEKKYEQKFADKLAEKVAQLEAKHKEEKLRLLKQFEALNNKNA